MIRFSCPACSTVISAPIRKSGTVDPCPNCAQPVQVPPPDEAAYESALAIELDDAGLRYVRQKVFPAFYKGRRLGQYQVDLIVEDLVVVEIKSVEVSKPLFQAQLLTYLRVAEKRVGLLINFNSRLLKDGVTRRVL